MADGPVRIDVRQLCPGLYVSLGGGWLEHDFLFSSFRIANDAQVRRIRGMGRAHVEYWPSRSTATPLPLPVEPPPQPPSPSAPEQDAQTVARRARIDRMAARRAALARCERAYRRTDGAVRALLAEVFVSPRDAGARADALVDEIVGDLLATPHAVLHLMGDGPPDAGARHHALNVMILSLMLGRAAGLPETVLRAVGLGALLHDLGKVQVPHAVLRIDPAARNRHEELAYRSHVELGVALLGELGVGAQEVLEIVRHHHERLDGSGFPAGLAGDAIPLPARVVAIANRYDGLCHPPDARRAASPSEALARMYRHESAAWDPALLQRFVKCLGVWPPGSVVRLSNEAIGMVVSVATDDTLRPTVLVADLGIPRSEAAIVDLREASDVRVLRALRVPDVDADVLAYLSPRMRAAWFAGADAGR